MEQQKRKSIRLKNYDYSSSGAYFITICVKNKKNLLWNVGAICGRPFTDNHYLSDYGLVVNNEICKINEIYKNSVILDKYVIMPNHMHMILILHNEVDGRIQVDGQPQVAPTISRIIQQFKGSVSKQIGFSMWQKLFHDHVIRNEQEYLKIWEYIDTNPLKWELDRYHAK